MVDHLPVKGTRQLSHIYQRCNVAVCEPVGYNEAKNDEKWVAAMKEELFMIEKNMAWELIDQPEDRKIIGLK